METEDEGQDGKLEELRESRYNWREIWTRFKPFLRPHTKRIVFSAVCIWLVGVAVAVGPLFPKYVIDTAIPARSLWLAFAAAGIFLASQLFRMVFWYLAIRQVFFMQQSIVFELRAKSFSHLQKLCLRFHARHPSGYIYERVFGSSINNIGVFMQEFFQQLATYASGLLSSLAICLWLSPALTGVTLVGAACYVVVARTLSGRIYRKTQLSVEAGMKVVDMIMDKLRGFKTIQAFGIESQVQAEFEGQLWPVMRKSMAAVLESKRFQFVTEGISYLLTAAVLVTGASLVMGKTLPLGTLVAFIGYQGVLVGMIQALANFYGQFMAARAAFDNLFSILDTNSSIVELPNAKMPPSVKGDIEFRDVSFSYGSGPVVLDQLNLKIPYGRTVAILGRSGSGKTTATSLLMRFHDPSAGAILLDGVDIRTLPLQEYRSLFGVVLQDPYLFDTSVAANLRYIKPDASDAELIEVLKAARAWDFVQHMPGGLEAKVGEGGSALSGGQRQRLAIARCLLTDSRFVLLDEATSALDPESEALVNEAVQTLFKNRSVLVIAHRLSTIRHAHELVVFDEGKVVERGTYEQLLAKNGLFHKFHAASGGGTIQ